ncbi:MAG: hypothetical protein LBR28_01135 [Bacteroidales bacterium]|jgi:hypothetical protein|nr:hypothetical protein [Bacteroidales bacterium]
MKKILLSLVAALSFATLTTAQENVKFSASADFVSRYVWRGQDLGGSSPSIQPGASVSWKGFSFGVWGAFNLQNLANEWSNLNLFNPRGVELDWTLAYTFCNDMFTVQVTDYSFPASVPAGHDYWYFKEDHVFEAGLKFNGLENLPLRAELYVNFFGNDKYSIGLDDEDGIVTPSDIIPTNTYSTYAELSYNPTIQSLGLDVSVFAGFAFNGGYTYSDYFDLLDMDVPTYLNPDEYIYTGFYGNKGFRCVNLGIGVTKQVNFFKLFTFPITAKVILNPNTSNSYLVVGTGFSF